MLGARKKGSVSCPFWGWCRVEHAAEYAHGAQSARRGGALDVKHGLLGVFGDKGAALFDFLAHELG